MGTQTPLGSIVNRLENLEKIVTQIAGTANAVSDTEETVADVSRLVAELKQQFPNPNEVATPVLARSARRRRRVLFTVLLDLIGAASVAYTLNSFLEISAFAFMIAGVGLALTLLQLYDYVCAPEWELYEKIGENPVAVSVFMLALAVLIHGAFAAGR